jgi:tricorn protease interacting factor F2/3
LNIEAYDLLFDVDFWGLSYKAKEKIHVKDCDGKLILDSVGHEYLRFAANGTEINKSSTDYDAVTSKLSLNNLPHGNVVVEIDFFGKVNSNSLHGFYKSSYGSGYVLATDFEPMGARHLFPCVDNPNFKAEICLEVIVDDERLKVISNMSSSNIVSVSSKDLLWEEEEEGRSNTTAITTNNENKKVEGKKRKITFAKTPKMPTYIFFLGIGEFEEMESFNDEQNHSSSVKIIGASTPGKSMKTSFAVENAAKFLKIYENYYSIPYPLPKLHLIALPEYAAGAMENWGAITFREAALLVDENSSVMNKRNVARVVGHEVAHQWFGNLVTMKWWNDLWLNESFATFLETKMADKLYPEWKNWNDFLMYDTSPAMEGDSLQNTHPIQVEVRSPDEISGIFDEISYGKGASILRMIEAYLGEESFRRGIASYLSKFKYSNAEGSDLWKCLAESSGQPVERIMETWIRRPGYPYIEASIRSGKIIFKQRRFFLSGTESSASLRQQHHEQGETNEERWPIPLTYLVNGRVERFLLEDESAEIEDNSFALDPKKFEFKVNLNQTGFYRVLYSPELYDILQSKFQNFGEVDRYGIISDIFAFIVSGVVSFELYFSFAKKCFQETSYLIVNTIAEQLRLLYFLAPESEKVREAYSEFYNWQMSRLGFSPKERMTKGGVQEEGSEDEEKMLRGTIARGLAVFDDKFAAELAKKFEEYTSLDPNIRTAVAIAYARAENNERAFSRLADMAERAQTEADVIKILWGLTHFKDPVLIRKALDFSLSGRINRGDCLYAVSAACSNSDARDANWKWFEENFDKIRQVFSGTGYAGTLAEDVIPSAGLDRPEEEVKAYASRLSVPEAERGIRKGLELLGVYSKARKRLISAK